jgi:hypothetical protein
MKELTTTLFLCVPVMEERENIPDFLHTIRRQNTSKRVVLVFCVNQPHKWWDNPKKKHVCLNNQETLKLLSQEKELSLAVIDKATQGWDEKHYGVGWARKKAMDYAAAKAKDNDILFSMDADTFYPPDYLEKTANNLLSKPGKNAVAIPYYHPLPADKKAARAILRYEIYMRHYALNMWRIKSPYRFTALGSAIALPVWAYHKIGGITPKVAGEDFYFLQKLRKSGEILYSNPVKAFPQARYSSRVLFGTGPAMLKGSRGDWNSYPIYHPKLFDEVQQLYKNFERYYETGARPLPDEKLVPLFPDMQWLDLLKKNSSTKEQFLKKCHTKFDGLKTVQYLKQKQLHIADKEEEILKTFLLKYYPEKAKPCNKIIQELNFENTTIADLNNIRNLMTAIERNLLERNEV